MLFASALLRLGPSTSYCADWPRNEHIPLAPPYVDNAPLPPLGFTGLDEVRKFVAKARWGGRLETKQLGNGPILLAHRSYTSGIETSDVTLLGPNREGRLIPFARTGGAGWTPRFLNAGGMLLEFQPQPHGIDRLLRTYFTNPCVGARPEKIPATQAIRVPGSDGLTLKSTFELLVYAYELGPGRIETLHHGDSTYCMAARTIPETGSTDTSVFRMQSKEGTDQFIEVLHLPANFDEKIVHHASVGPDGLEVTGINPNGEKTRMVTLHTQPEAKSRFPDLYNLSATHRLITPSGTWVAKGGTIELQR